MRSAFEAWAQRDGHITRRREDKPDEYLVFETQRRWMIWQAALSHGKTANAAPKAVTRKDGEAAPAGGQKAAALAPDETAVRNRVLNEVLDAFSELDDNTGIAGLVKVIQGLKKKQRALAEEKT